MAREDVGKMKKCISDIMPGDGHIRGNNPL